MRTIHLTDVNVNCAVKLRDYFLFEYRFDHDCNIEVDDRFIKTGCLILDFTFFRTADVGRFVIDFYDGSGKVHFTVLPYDERDYLEESIVSFDTKGEYCHTIRSEISKMLDSSSLFDYGFGRPEWKSASIDNRVLPSSGNDTHWASVYLRDRASACSIDFYPIANDREDLTREI